MESTNDLINSQQKLTNNITHEQQEQNNLQEHKQKKDEKEELELTQTEQKIIPNKEIKINDTKIKETETKNIPVIDTNVHSNNNETTNTNANNDTSTTTNDNTKDTANINTNANEIINKNEITETKVNEDPKTKANEIIVNEITNTKSNENTNINRDSNTNNVDIISPKEGDLLTTELSTSPQFTTVIPENIKQKIETEVTPTRASKPKSRKRKSTVYTDFYEFPKINSNLRGINFLGEDYFLEYLTYLDGENGVIKNLNCFVDSLLQVNKEIPENFITVRFIVCEYTFMGIFFQLLNFKRSDNIFLQPNSFNNILLIINKILDRINVKIATIFGRILSNDKEYDLLQYVVILGQTFYQKQEHQTEDNKYVDIMSKQLGRHPLFQEYKTWEKLIEYHIKKQKKNLKKLKQKITKEREKTIAINTIVTYLFNMKNFGVDESRIDNIKKFAERNEIPKELIESKFD